MGLALAFGRDGEGVDGGIAGDIKVYGFLEGQALLHLLAQGIKAAQEIFVCLHAVAFHAAPPVLVVRGAFGVLADKLDHIALQSAVNLACKLFLKGNFGK